MNPLARLLDALRRTSFSSPPTQNTVMSLPAQTILIDVRSTDEFNSGHIEGAVNLPLDRIQRDIAGVVPDEATPMLLYCRSGARSGRACEIVSQLGYATTRNGGGIGSLAMALGRPVTRA
jgi:phage shock protein E